METALKQHSAETSGA